MSKKNTFRLLASSAVFALAAAGSAYASSHREAPSIAGNPRVDGTDLYMFNSYESGRAGYVTIIANFNPLQDAYGGPNYFALDPNALYEIHVDNDGDAKEDLTFRFAFSQTQPGGNGIALPVGGQQVAVPLKNVGPISAASNANLNFNETYTVKLLRGETSPFGNAGSASDFVKDAANGSTTFTKPFDYNGNKTFGSKAGYEAYANQYIRNVTIPGCATTGRVFVGQRKEGFAVNLGKIFDLVNLVPIEAGAFPGGIAQSPDNNTVANKNVTSIALELPVACLKGNGNGVIGAWSTASLPQLRTLDNKPTIAQPESTVSGIFTQVSRLGMPLVNEVVIGLRDKDKFNASSPKGDSQFATYVTNPTLPALLNILFRDAVNSTLGANIPDLAPTNFPRTDLVAAFLTGIKGINQQAKVTPSEMLRLNTTIAPTPVASQKSLGVLGGDLAGFPNGRRPGDDVVDAELRVAMGVLCYQPSLNLCTPANAAVGNVPFTDGAPVSAADFPAAFPYLATPIAGSL